MSASPYREPGAPSRPAGRWDARRLLGLAFGLVAAMAVISLVLALFTRSSASVSGLTLADPESPQRVLRPPAQDLGPETRGGDGRNWEPSRGPRNPYFELIPVHPPSDPSEHSGSGSPLTDSQIQAVLNGHKMSIRRNCVERIGAASGTTNEQLAITIDGTGHVASAVADGNNATIGACIEKDVKGWVFPRTGATTKMVLPFVYVIQ